MAALERKGVHVERRPARSMTDALSWLGTREILSVLVEGGPVLQEACAAEDLIDRVQVAIAPWNLGTGGVPAAGFIRRAIGDLNAVRGRDLGGDRLIDWDVHGTDRSDWAH
jgi:riboflavin biosynthesis pyrimidine reductase